MGAIALILLLLVVLAVLAGLCIRMMLPLLFLGGLLMLLCGAGGAGVQALFGILVVLFLLVAAFRLMLGGLFRRPRRRE